MKLDLAIFKSFFNRDAGGHFRPNELQFRVGAGNIPNTPQFQTVSSDLQSLVRSLIMPGIFSLL